MNKETGEIPMSGKLNELIIIKTRRPDGSLRIQKDFSNCPSMTEQHSGHLTDINWLMANYQPDQLAAYLAERNSRRREILGHDFSVEPSLQQAKNIVLKLKKDFEALPDEVKENFNDHVEFLKFIDNPANAEKMIKLGLMTPKQIQNVKGPLNDEPNNDQDQTQPQTKKSSSEAKKSSTKEAT